MTSVKRRLLAGTGIGVALALAISGVLVFVLAKRALVAQFDDALLAKARALSILVEQDEGRIEFEDISPRTPPGEYFELYAGESLLRSTTLGDRHLTQTDGASELGRQRAIVFTPRGEDETTNGAQPTATFVYARATDELDATIANLRNILIAVGLGALALTFAILIWIARVGLRPVDQLATDIGNVRDLAPLDTQRPRELVPIALELNRLLARVQQSMTRERELTAEVAHELRTPLTGLRATIELALDRERPVERYRTALEDCLAICTQTERMVESMLSLAKLDAGVAVLERSPVDVADVLREVLAAHPTHKPITTELAPLILHTDKAKLASILHNLVDNALAYGNTVTITINKTIQIANDTTLENADHVFERFWRGDAARSAGTHAGLGLAITKRLVEILGWTIRAEVIDKQFVATIVVDSARRAP